MAFNIMNVSNIEAKTINGVVSVGASPTLITAPANGAVKIKYAYFMNTNAGGGSPSYFQFQYKFTPNSQFSYSWAAVGGRQGTSDYWGGDAPVFVDVWIPEGESFQLYANQTGIWYTISYEIWT